MITAVDSSVLIDIFQREPQWGVPSADTLYRCIREGCAVACDVVWSEVGAAFPDIEMFAYTMKEMPVEFSPVSAEAAALAGTMWRKYCDRGGKRNRVVPDFLIAAHAMTQCDRLLTRDRGFYRDYFSGLNILAPSSR